VFVLIAQIGLRPIMPFISFQPLFLKIGGESASISSYLAIENHAFLIHFSCCLCLIKAKIQDTWNFNFYLYHHLPKLFYVL